MTTASFQKTSWSWQLQQLVQQLQEWIEVHVQPPSVPSSDLDLPQWTLSQRFLDVLFWGLILGGSVFLLWKIWPVLQRILGARRKIWSAWQPQRQPPVLTHAQWLQRSKRLAQQGNYPEACRSLYFALLHGLEATGHLPQSHSLTDQEYLHFLQANPRLQSLDAVAIVLQMHEQLCFSPCPLGETEFLTCLQALQTLNLESV